MENKPIPKEKEQLDPMSGLPIDKEWLKRVQEKEDRESVEYNNITGKITYGPDYDGPRV